MSSSPPDTTPAPTEATAEDQVQATAEESLAVASTDKTGAASKSATKAEAIKPASDGKTDKAAPDAAAPAATAVLSPRRLEPLPPGTTSQMLQQNEASDTTDALMASPSKKGPPLEPIVAPGRPMLPPSSGIGDGSPTSPSSPLTPKPVLERRQSSLDEMSSLLQGITAQGAKFDSFLGNVQSTLTDVKRVRLSAEEQVRNQRASVNKLQELVRSEPAWM